MFPLITNTVTIHNLGAHSRELSRIGVRMENNYPYETTNDNN